MLHKRKQAVNVTAFDAGSDDGYQVGYYQRRGPQTMLPDQVPERFSESASRQSYIDGWQEGYFKGSRAREINR